MATNALGSVTSPEAALTLTVPYTFTTLAGDGGGSEDGTGSAARLWKPRGVAVDGAGNVYVADTSNFTIRKITPAGLVTTLAGKAGSEGNADGVGSVARFGSYYGGPIGVTVDSAGNVFVADTGNYSIRKVTAAGAVTTLAALRDGTGKSTSFNQPLGVAVDGSGNLYVADTDNGPQIRKLTTSGVVTTLAGGGGVGSADGTGTAALFGWLTEVAVDSTGNIYAADQGNNVIRKLTPVGTNWVVTTLAGLAQSDANGHPVLGSADGMGSTARFNGPSGVAVDSAGNVYVADTGNNTIRRVTPTGVVTTLAGRAGTTGSADGTGGAARFRDPQAVAVDSAGNVYVADTGNNTIRKVTPAGMVTTLAGRSGGSGDADGAGDAARFTGPWGTAVDSAGTVYAADTDNSTIRRITPAGVVTTLAGQAGSPGGADGPGGAAKFNSPEGVAVDSAGNVYVADTLNCTIRKITPAGVVTTLAGQAGSYGSSDGTGSTARFGRGYFFDFGLDLVVVGPSGLAVDSAGNVYVADTGNSSIRKVTPAGVVTTLAGGLAAQYDAAGNLVSGGPGSADGMGNAAQFTNPQGVAVDSAGDVYVADSGNFTIRKVTPAGEVTTLAGLAGSSGSTDGAGSDARFGGSLGGPVGVAVDSAGNVYVADTYNYTIRKVTPSGVVTTLAGSLHLDEGGNPIGGTADGTGSDARFVAPHGVAVDSTGNLYVADTGNNTIRKGYLGYSAEMILTSGSSFGFNAGQFGFNLATPVGQSLIVEASTDLVTWLPIWTNTSTLSFSDPQSGAVSHRFYRARTQ